MEPVACASCKQTVVPEPPSPLWMVLNVLFGIVVLLIGAVFSLILVLNIVLLPLWMVFMAGAVAVTTRRALMWRCPECHAEMFPTPAEKKRLRAARRRGPRHHVLVPRHGH